MKHFRQGDVLVRLVKAVPAQAVEKTPEGAVILAYGEVTGHCHQISKAAGVKVYEHEGTRYIRVPKDGADLKHEEHGTVQIAGGDYEVVIQKEYVARELRNVAD